MSRIANLIDQAAVNAGTAWEKKFIQDLQERYADYGERIFLSPKQTEILERIADVPEEIPAFEREVVAAYVAPSPTQPAPDVFEALRLQMAEILGDVALTYPDAPGEALQMLLDHAAAYGWRFAPDTPTPDMCAAWSNPTSPFAEGPAQRAHCGVVYREMMQLVPTIGRKTNDARSQENFDAQKSEDERRVKAVESYRIRYDGDDDLPF